jgi:DNA-binding NarL/FixJ family response regulator
MLRALIADDHSILRQGLADLKRIRPNLPALILSASAEDQYARRLLKAGASGYLGKDSAAEELSHAVRKLLAGGLYISAVLAEKLAMELHQDPGRPCHETLSDRELEVLRLIASGKGTSQIAGQLTINVTTVSTYRARIQEKLSLTSTAELVSFALRNQLAE